MDPAYLLIRSRIHDPEGMKTYATLSEPVVARYGPQYLAKAPTIVCLDGEYDGSRVILVRYPNAEKLLEFWNSPEYAPLKEMRRRACTADIWMIPGLPETKL
jgi:uncharacterized protein (DUF1330 family)